MPEQLKPTEGELAILQILWKAGPSTVRFVHEQLNQRENIRSTGYTTTLKLMQIMYEKALLDREKQGKTHIYEPLVSESQTQQDLLMRLMNTAFGGSAMKLVMQALGNHHSTTDELDQIKAYIDSLEKEQLSDNKGS